MRSSAFAGWRVAITGGPRAGQQATVRMATGARQYVVELDGGGTATVLRSVCTVLSRPAAVERAPRKAPHYMPWQRMVALFAADPALHQVVVYRTLAGRTFVAPWREQDVGPGLIGVYGRSVQAYDLEADLRA